MVTSDLAAWLAAIYDEDEARLSDVTFCGPVWPTTDQLLARIAADRKVLSTYVAFRDAPERMTDVRADSWWRALDAAVRLLASAHATRPGYLEEWRA